MAAFTPLFQGSYVYLNHRSPVDPTTLLPLARPDGLSLVQQLSCITFNLFGRECTSEPVALQGEYNFVFRAILHPARFPFNNPVPRSVIFRFPNQHKKSSCLSLDSEVTTMEHVRRNTNIPVPEVYAFCDNGSFFGENFIVMQDFGPVSQLSTVWDTLSPPAKERFMREYVGYTLELTRVLSVGNIGGMHPQGNHGGWYIGGLNSFLNHDERKTTTHHRQFHRSSFAFPLSWLDHRIIDHLKITARNIPLGGDVGEQAVRLRNVLYNISDALPLVLETFDKQAGMHCLVRGKNGGNDFLVWPSNHPNAGSIVAVLSWEGTNFLPIWLTPGLPGGIDDEDDSDEEDDAAETVEDMYHRLIREMDTQGHLTRSLDDEYRMLAELAGAIEEGDAERLENWLHRAQPILNAIRSAAIQHTNTN